MLDDNVDIAFSRGGFQRPQNIGVSMLAGSPQ